MIALQLDLFEPLESVEATPSRIRGLTYLRDFITSDEEKKIASLIDAKEWSGELSRRVQHYGYKYDYKVRNVNEAISVESLPKWLQSLGKRLVRDGFFDIEPDQVIVNEYLPGQGITTHIDCLPCFGDTIVSLSLGSTCVMDFTNAKTEEAIPILLEPRSIVILKEEARYLWKHGIAKRKQDKYNGVTYLRSRRISLTFRTMKWE